MKILKRNITDTLLRFAKFPVVGVFGPRQSGKTTIVREVFKDHKYLNFEDPDTRDFALNDPKLFLSENENKNGIILDEFQYVPQILSYIQLEVDEKKRPGYFVLTGSQNFLMNQAITQSLAGRIGILTLLPLSINELQENNLIKDKSFNLSIINGGYPRIYSENFTAEEFYPSYIHSYAERDVRQLINVENLTTFRMFMKLCAGRIGQLLNISDLAMNCGISQNTANSWLSILEASYILFMLQPHHNNFNKRVVKTPKIFFYDTGLASSLLGIKTSEELLFSTFRGHLFENLIIADFFKQYFNAGKQPSLYFWRDKNGIFEVDCIVEETVSKLIPIEIKSTQTVMSSLFDSLVKWYDISASKEKGYLVYGGDLTQNRQNGKLVGWQDAGSLILSLKDSMN